MHEAGCVNSFPEHLVPLPNLIFYIYWYSFLYARRNTPRIMEWASERDIVNDFITIIFISGTLDKISLDFI